MELSSENTKLSIRVMNFGHADKIVVSEAYSHGEADNIYAALTAMGYKIMLLTQNRPASVSQPCLIHPRTFLGRNNDPHLGKDEVLKSVREQFPSEN